MFSILSETNFNFSVTFILWFANAFYLDLSRILSCGNELRIRIFQMVLSLCNTYPQITLSQTNPVCSRSLLKTLWEKEKLLVRSNFSFFHGVFYPFGKLSVIFIIFEMGVFKVFLFRRA